MRIHLALVTVATVVGVAFLASDALGQARVQGEVTDKSGNGLVGVQIAVERTDGGAPIRGPVKTTAVLHHRPAVR